MTLPDNTCIMYLVRHGATKNNMAKPPRLQGRREDPSLSDEGRQQAECAAKLLEDLPLTAALSSPLLRAKETAQIIAAPHDLPVDIEPLT